MTEIHAHIFTGVLDTDTDERAVSNQDFVDASDLLIGYGATPGSAVFPKGNSLHSYTLPAGTNQVIGATEDKQTRSLYRFMYNSAGAHHIIRYQDGQSTLVAKGSVLGFDFTRKITHAKVVNGTLLYWTDAKTGDAADRLPGASSVEGEPPRKINVIKADITKENFEYDLYAGVVGEGQFANGRTYTFRTTDVDGGDPQDENIYTADGAFENDPAAGLNWLKGLLEADYPDDLIIEDCDGCKLKITYVNVGSGRRLELETSNGDALLVGVNIYPPVLEYYHIDLLKEPAHCAPSACYVYDGDTSTNNVRRLCAQFRVRYIYDDDERSVWGPVSNIAINTDVAGEVIDTFNAIEIDFTDVRLSDPSWLTMIRFVEVAFRDGNSDDWKLIERLPVCEIGIQAQSYTFRNDKTYATIPSDELSTESDLQVLKPFDYVPIKCGTLEVSADEQGNTLLFAGACVESYDNPDCVEMTVEAIEYADDCLIDIIGTVVIDNDSNFPGDSPDFDYYPLGGQVVYLAGTTFFAISNNPADGTGDGSFRIKGVPNGRKYILRAASHRCSFSNDHGPRLNLGNGLEWQKTSAPVIEMAGSLTAGPCQYERLIDLSLHGGGDFDLDTEAGYGTVDIANQHYARRVTTTPPAADSITLFEYHVLDNNFQNADNADRIAARGAERQKVLGNARSTGVGSDAELVTDHNGYCFDRRFHPSGTAIISGSIPVDENDYHPAFANRQMYQGGFKELYEDTLINLGGTDVDGPTNQYLIINEAEAFSALKHVLQSTAYIQDTVTPLPGVLMNYQRNGYPTRSGLDGVVKIPYWIPYDIAPDRNDDNLIAVYLTDVCNEGPPASDELPVEIEDPFDDPYVVADFVFIVSLITYKPAHFLKGGGEYDWGIVYEDRGNRTPGAVRTETLRIPVHPDGLTKWRMQWSISSVPPDWATHYRIVRMLNAVHTSYVQWTLREALYVRIPSNIEDPIETTFDAGDATHILFGLYTPVQDTAATTLTAFFYSAEGQQGYIPQEGDRVRLILDASGAPLNSDTSVIEAEIQGYYQNADGEYYAIVPNVFGSFEVKEGILAEYLTPRTVESGIYYEGGEDCYEIGDPGESTRYHKGPIDDQVPGVTPASGVYTGGDTYWRRQLFTNTGIYLTEHPTPNRLIANACEDIGRPFSIGNLEQQFFFNRHRVSAPYIPNSTVNGLSSFSALDYQDINRQFGVIKSTVFADNVLLAICQFKVQPIYIGRDSVLFLEGQGALGRSDRIMNIANDSVSDYGTSNPESVVSESGRVYFWDQYHGAMCRYAQNGVQEINNGNVKFFRALADEREGVNNVFVYGGYDRRHHLYFVSFPDFGNMTAVTMCFDEVKSAWVPKAQFIPEMYGRLGQDLITFKSGALWTHYTNALYANYYGVQYKPYITIVINTSPGLTKIFKSIRIDSNNKFELTSITIPASYDYATGMLSEIPASYFNSYEGRWHANFLRDKNDTAKQFRDIADVTDRAVTALLRGRQLRGEVMRIKIEAVDGSLDTKITRADVYFLRSEVSHP